MKSKQLSNRSVQCVMKCKGSLIASSIAVFYLPLRSICTESQETTAASKRLIHSYVQSIGLKSDLVADFDFRWST